MERKIEKTKNCCNNDHTRKDIKSDVLWDMTLPRLVAGYRCFRGNNCIRPQRKLHNNSDLHLGAFWFDSQTRQQVS